MTLVVDLCSRWKVLPLRSMDQILGSRLADVSLKLRATHDNLTFLGFTVFWLNKSAILFYFII